MSWTLFADAAQPGKIEKLDSGMVRVRGRVARTGVQAYAPWPGAPIQDRAINVYRPPTEVFADSSLRTLKGVPVTIEHPPERAVDSKNWKRYAVGHNEGEHTRSTVDGEEYVETSLLIADAEAVKRIVDKDLVEISQGYTVELDWSPGVTNDGIPYDAIQTQITHNHTALLGVGSARAGTQARVLLDSHHEDQMKKEQFLKLLDSELKAIDSKARARIDGKVRGILEPMLDSLSEEQIKALLTSTVKTVAANDEGEKEEEEKKEEDEGEGELSEEEKKKKEEEAAKATDSEDAGRKLAQQILDSQSQTLAVIDARHDVADMLPEGFEYSGKSVKALHLAAIKNKAPQVFESVKDASEAEIRGAFKFLKANRTVWVKTDAAPVRKDEEHKVNYNKRMNDAFDASWSK